MRKILVTGATQNYFPVISPYLETISAHSNFDVNILVMLDCDLETPPNIRPVRLSSEALSIRHSNSCLQHGEFMSAPEFGDFSPDDIVCFTDGDVLMQRPLDAGEISLLESLSDNDVLVQFNAGKDDNLRDEYYRLQPAMAHAGLEALLGVDFSTLGCYNTGVVVCNKRTWAEILRRYQDYFPLVKQHAGFTHYAAQQWLLSLIFSLHMKVRPMEPSFHAHFHYGRSPSSRFSGNVHHEDEAVVLFSHFAMREGLPISKEGFAKHQSEYLRRNLNKAGWRRSFWFLRRS
jgi:hypothetical protein